MRGRCRSLLQGVGASSALRGAAKGVRWSLGDGNSGFVGAGTSWGMSWGTRMLDRDLDARPPLLDHLVVSRGELARPACDTSTPASTRYVPEPPIPRRASSLPNLGTQPAWPRKARGASCTRRCSPLMPRLVVPEPTAARACSICTSFPEGEKVVREKLRASDEVSPDQRCEGELPREGERTSKHHRSLG